MHEVEVKALVRDRSALEAGLRERGIELGKPMRQDDLIFVHGSWEDVQDKVGRIALRLRDQEGELILTLKQNGENELHSVEHETTVGSAAETLLIIEALGFKKLLEIRKVRRKGRCGSMEICLDEVDGLGTYVEAERMLDEAADADAVQEELFGFLESLGVMREDREMRGYDTLIRLRAEGRLVY